MNQIRDFIESGIIELYVMGAASPEEVNEVKEMAAVHPEVRQEVENISLALEQYAQAQAVKPRGTVKTLLLATIDYIQRMEQGEQPEVPPVLTAESRISDYAYWLDKEDNTLPEDADNIYAKIIGFTPSATTAIVWLKELSDEEVHHDEYERFLIVEGTCNMRTGQEMFQLAAGDYFAIPLHISHQLTVTSDVPCKAILQRLSVA